MNNKLINSIELMFQKYFGKSNPRLDGTNLFSMDYLYSTQYKHLTQIFGRSPRPIIRIPVQSNTIQAFLNTVKEVQADCDIIACLDSYESDQAMLNRLETIKRCAPYIEYIELFNELPFMNAMYPGKQIQSLAELIDITNKYTAWIHQNIPNCKVISMAPYDSMDETIFGWNTTNTEILRQLMISTSVDITAIHLYGEGFDKERQLVTLGKNMQEWNKESKTPKEFFVTECGIGNWNNHVNYYNTLIKLIVYFINPEKILWYRQCIQSKELPDNGFALEVSKTSEVSPLFTLLSK